MEGRVRWTTTDERLQIMGCVNEHNVTKLTNLKTSGAFLYTYESHAKGYTVMMYTELPCTHEQELNAATVRTYVHSHLCCSLPDMLSALPPLDHPIHQTALYHAPCRVTHLNGKLEKNLKCRATVILNA